MPVSNQPKSEFQKELKTLINKHSMEQFSDTPDFVLAEYLNNCLKAFNGAVSASKNFETPTKPPEPALV